MSDVPRRMMAGLLMTGVLAFVDVSAAEAQRADVDTRWQAWFGCWQPSDAPRTSEPELVCVVPVSEEYAVDLVGIAGGEEMWRERLDATGEPRGVTEDGCTGWKSGQWSSDGRRVYLRSDITCPGAPRRTSSGVLAMTSGGEWLDIEAVSAGGGSGVRVVRYRDAGIPADAPREITRALAGRQLAVSAARMAAGARVDLPDVVDATRQLDAAAVQAWLVERGQEFSLDARQLAWLADAGVPGSVTDVMVALAYPKVFALDRATYEGELREPTDSARARGAYPRGGRFGGGYGPYGFSRYGYSRYGYSPFGYGWYSGRSPYIIVRRSSREAAGAVKGRGYTHGRPSGGTVTGTRPRGSVGSSGSGGGNSSGGRSGGSGRKAKPRP